MKFGFELGGAASPVAIQHFVEKIGKGLGGAVVAADAADLNKDLAAVNRIELAQMVVLDEAAETEHIADALVAGLAAQVAGGLGAPDGGCETERVVNGWEQHSLEQMMATTLAVVVGVKEQAAKAIDFEQELVVAEAHFEGA